MEVIKVFFKITGKFSDKASKPIRFWRLFLFTFSEAPFMLSKASFQASEVLIDHFSLSDLDKERKR